MKATYVTLWKWEWKLKTLRCCKLRMLGEDKESTRALRNMEVNGWSKNRPDVDSEVMIIENR